MNAVAYPGILFEGVQQIQLRTEDREIIKMYEGESKCKGKIHLTALTEVTVSNFTYHFST